jgi:uncharacterized membrane protein
MKYTGLAAAVIALAMGAIFVAPAEAGYITFDPPGSNYTIPTRINAKGAIIGYWSDGYTYHGFLRAPDGTITNFDPPGSLVTTPLYINDKGFIVGRYTPDHYEPRYHGFVRHPDGKITSYDAPKSPDETSIVGINKTNTITGYYEDRVGYHGFVRDRAGNFKSFDVPYSFQTFPTAINDDGSVTGYYFAWGQTPCGGFNIGGFDRAPAGKMRTFLIQSGAYPMSINSDGVISGNTVDDSCVVHGFVRDAVGQVQLFGFPDDPNVLNTTDLNRYGTIVGWFFEKGRDQNHGFRRDPDGTFTRIEPDGTKSSLASAINASGQITGWHVAKHSTALHGFLYTP